MKRVFRIVRFRPVYVIQFSSNTRLSQQRKKTSFKIIPDVIDFSGFAKNNKDSFPPFISWDIHHDLLQGDSLRLSAQWELVINSSHSVDYRLILIVIPCLNVNVNKVQQDCAKRPNYDWMKQNIELRDSFVHSAIIR